jgi:hypothetical protein
METPASGSRFLLLYDASVRQAPAQWRRQRAREPISAPFSTPAFLKRWRNGDASAPGSRVLRSSPNADVPKSASAMDDVRQAELPNCASATPFGFCAPFGLCTPLGLYTPLGFCAPFGFYTPPRFCTPLAVEGKPAPQP